MATMLYNANMFLQKATKTKTVFYCIFVALYQNFVFYVSFYTVCSLR